MDSDMRQDSVLLSTPRLTWMFASTDAIAGMHPPHAPDSARGRAFLDGLGRHTTKTRTIGGFGFLGLPENVL